VPVHKTLIALKFAGRTAPKKRQGLLELKCVAGELENAQRRKRTYADRAKPCAQRDNPPAPLQREQASTILLLLNRKNGTTTSPFYFYSSCLTYPFAVY
jgi:hypothetical protein